MPNFSKIHFFCAADFDRFGLEWPPYNFFFIALKLISFAEFFGWQIYILASAIKLNWNLDGPWNTWTLYMSQHDIPGPQLHRVTACVADPKLQFPNPIGGIPLRWNQQLHPSTSRWSTPVSVHEWLLGHCLYPWYHQVKICECKCLWMTKTVVCCRKDSWCGNRRV